MAKISWSVCWDNPSRLLMMSGTTHPSIQSTGVQYIINKTLWNINHVNKSELNHIADSVLFKMTKNVKCIMIIRMCEIKLDKINSGRLLMDYKWSAITSVIADHIVICNVIISLTSVFHRIMLSLYTLSKNILHFSLCCWSAEYFFLFFISRWWTDRKML